MRHRFPLHIVGSSHKYGMALAFDVGFNGAKLRAGDRTRSRLHLNRGNQRIHLPMNNMHRDGCRCMENFRACKSSDCSREAPKPE
jgi:hypothetical protein